VSEEFLTTHCCIAGGGPAGIMAGYLLARAGVDVIVLEKHADFFRDFRGDTIHPSTLRIVDELGLLDDFLKVPHNEIRELSARFGDTVLKLADFRHVPGRCKFLALMPQWDFLNFMAEHARPLATFRLIMNAEATDLIRGNGRIVGVTAQTPQSTLTITADLVIAADGRSSTLRERAGLEVLNIGAPIDVLWMRISRKVSDPPQSFGNIAPGGFLVTIDRGDYYQCAFVIHKGGYDEVRARGLEQLREKIVSLAPFLGDRIGELQSWDQISMLSVSVDRLKRWYAPGLLCIGDAAHAMSPVGGIGINLAIQDAVATANALAEPLRRGPVEPELLESVERRREFPTKLTQWLQVTIQNRVLAPVLAGRMGSAPPLIVRIIGTVPLLRQIPAYVVGIGFRPEHVRSSNRELTS
jgi:2-polyprenyl-6-methoxyphenol hydroxylase-like FAD-dependent oxidoreductase